MCCDDKLFDELHSLEQPLEVMLGDGYAVKETGAWHCCVGVDRSTWNS